MRVTNSFIYLCIYLWVIRWTEFSSIEVPTELSVMFVWLQSLNKKRAVLREVQDKLARLQEKYEANVKKKADLEKQVQTPFLFPSLFTHRTLRTLLVLTVCKNMKMIKTLPRQRVFVEQLFENITSKFRGLMLEFSLLTDMFSLPFSEAPLISPNYLLQDYLFAPSFVLYLIGGNEFCLFTGWPLYQETWTRREVDRWTRRRKNKVVFSPTFFLDDF